MGGIEGCNIAKLDPYCLVRKTLIVQGEPLKTKPLLEGELNVDEGAWYLPRLPSVRRPRFGRAIGCRRTVKEKERLCRHGVKRARICTSYPVEGLVCGCCSGRGAAAGRYSSIPRFACLVDPLI
jgi:hypothetical protein